MSITPISTSKSSTRGQVHRSILELLSIARDNGYNSANVAETAINDEVPVGILSAKDLGNLVRKMVDIVNIATSDKLGSLAVYGLTMRVNLPSLENSLSYHQITDKGYDMSSSYPQDPARAGEILKEFFG